MSRLILLVLLLSVTNASHATSCVWDLNKDLPANDPIYISTVNAPSPVIPGPTGLSLALNETMTLVCPGKANVINGSTLQQAEVICSTDNKLLFNNQLATLNSIKCANNTLSDLIYTKISCAGDRGEMLKMGFNSTMGMATMVETCYDKVNEAAFFSINVIYGDAIEVAEIESSRPGFRNQGLTNGTGVANAYKQTEQTKVFTSLLGFSQANKYLSSTSYLARGHLAPDADYLFGTWSTATYFLVNAAPQWQVFNAGNWLRVEIMARNIASERQEDLIIYTGTHGVLQLPNSSGVLTDMYLLPGKKLPVPKWFWKIIYSTFTEEGIALVSLNNPHASSLNENDLICTSICKETQWDRPEWVNYDKGYTYCCSVNDLTSYVGTLPNINVKNNMTGPIKIN